MNAKTTPLRVAVLGAGPVGLEAALYAQAAGLNVTVYEAGQVGEQVNRWGHVRMFTPFGANITTLGRQTLFQEKPKREFPGEADVLSGREYREAYLVPLTETEALKPLVQCGVGVLTIGRVGWRKTDALVPNRPLPPFRLLLRDAKNVERIETADAIFDCTGTYGRPNWVGNGGIPALGEIAARPQASYWVDDVLGAKKQAYLGKTTLVIGSGTSAATTIANLAALADENMATWVIWLTYGAKNAPLPRIANDPWKERDRLAVRVNHLACRCDGNLEYHPQAEVEEFITHGPDKGFRVVATVGGKPHTWEVERVIANVGYRPDMGLVQELRIVEPAGDILTAEPNYFFLGAKSHGRGSGFFLNSAAEQIRRAVGLVLGNTKLDLYSKRAA
ncbi:MAG: NAD(P)-binding domain-containing protein [Gemmataceae bacterium]